tara:strand:+ start:447 stop:605 length:159 start_codon:yes stop_codon:yes gene_type:complete
MPNYKKGTPEYKAYKQGKKKKPGSGLNKLLAGGGLGLAGLLISSVMNDGKKR